MFADPFPPPQINLLVFLCIIAPRLRTRAKTGLMCLSHSLLHRPNFGIDVSELGSWTIGPPPSIVYDDRGRFSFSLGGGVFLRSKVVNISEFTLLPGEANVYMGDNFVSKSWIE
ncbi:unnamed protein product, partial [Rhizoctonia solani]